MSLVTVIWSVASGACLALAILHWGVWWQDRRATASLAFAVTSVSVVCVAACELGMMFAATPAAWGWWLYQMHVPALFVVAGSVWFVRVYLGTGRAWLAAIVIGVRVLIVVLNFAFESGVNFRAITSLQHLSVFGEELAILGEAVPNPWMWLGQASLVLWAIYAGDATWTLWRRGPADGRRAVLVGAGLTIFAGVDTLVTILALNGVWTVPFVATLLFQIFVFAVGYELTRGVLRAARLSRELRASEERLRLTASAGRVVLWEWQVEKDDFWISNEGRRFFAIPADEVPDYRQFVASVYPDDREFFVSAIERSIKQVGNFSLVFRRVLPDGSLRWFSSVGVAERTERPGGIVLRGASVDITAQRRAELEISRQRGELAHLSRVASLGELSGSLAHEINQPLAIILSNAQAAYNLLGQDSTDRSELRAILADIVKADHRAGDVIKRLRALLKGGEPERRSLSLAELADDTLTLTRSDLIAREVRLERDVPADLPMISGDRIALQQVLLNLITNACDAVSGNPPATRLLNLAIQRVGPVVQLSVRDCGCGLPPDDTRIFEPFYTTKPQGLGMGLSISRTIIAAHGGRLWAEPNPGGGAAFHFALPATEDGA